MSTMDELPRHPHVLRDEAPEPVAGSGQAVDADPVIMRYVGGGYLTVGGLPARDLRASDFVGTHWTPETAAEIEGGKVYEMAGKQSHETVPPGSGPAKGS